MSQPTPPTPRWLTRWRAQRKGWGTDSVCIAGHPLHRGTRMETTRGRVICRVCHAIAERRRRVHDKQADGGRPMPPVPYVPLHEQPEQPDEWPDGTPVAG